MAGGSLVVLVDWDGFDPAFLDLAPAPNLCALIGRGSLSIAQSTFPTVSNPARASMSTGAYPEVHDKPPTTSTGKGPWGRSAC